MSSDSHPFAVSRVDRRASLSRHFIPVVEELAEAGTPFVDLSVERIIKAGGISRSAFYNYFDDKADLLVAMADGVIADLIDTGRSWWALSPTSTKAELREALSAPLGNYRAHQMVLGAIVEVATYDERVRAKQEWLIGTVSSALADHIREGQRAGSVDPELDADRTARWLVWMLERGLYQMVTPADQGEAEKLMDAITDVVWRVLYAGFRDPE
ncbi:MAG TPA: TetR/AcrR family transcriptional regulator [Nocardioides sp.]|nr:TetR/AcrR family transcriptional regulator [Nocardioides sp.]